jgi:hypothetical protein
MNGEEELKGPETLNTLNISFAQFHMIYATLYLAEVSLCLWIIFIVVSIILKKFFEPAVRKETIYRKLTANLLEQLD